MYKLDFLRNFSGCGTVNSGQLCRVACLLVLVFCFCLAGGCREDGERSDGKKAESEAVSEPQPMDSSTAASTSTGGAPSPAPGEGVYALSTPEPAASEKERAHAQGIIDFSNAASMLLEEGVCGRYPALILQAVKGYREIFVAEPVSGPKPEVSCAAQISPQPDEGLFGSTAALLSADLATMDRERQSMQNQYAQLRKYAADTTIRDDGVRGDELCGGISTAGKAFAAAREHFFSLVNPAAEEAQDTLLRAHPLRGQFRLARRLFAAFQQAAGRIGADEPDPLSLTTLITGMDSDLTTAERLPFPLPGEAEMNYRAFLKSARALVDVLRRGQVESFHTPVRIALNNAWNLCRTAYNRFVDAAVGLDAPAPAGERP